MARHSQIVVSGAREHNLKDVTVALPRDARCPVAVPV